MTSKSITARENRRRQKLRALQPRFRGVKIHCSRSNERLVNGRWLPFCDTAYPLSWRRSRKDRERTVPADAFRWIPREKQCERCRSLSAIKEHGTHDHLMAVELLVAMLQRLWQARLDVGHRCYVSLVPRDMIDGGEGREAAGYTFCTCDGEPKWLDMRTSYCPPRLVPDRAAWEAYYGMPYEQLPSQEDRRWAPSPGTIRRMLAAKPGNNGPCPCAPGGGDGPHAEWCDGGK